MNLLDIVKNGNNNSESELFSLLEANETLKELDKKSSDFIKGELERRQKALLFEYSDLRVNPMLKGFHSVVLYRLGVYSENIFKGIIEEFINNHFPNNEMESPFEYVWKLTSFYHDVMAKFEDHEKDIIFESLPYIHCPLLTVESFLNTCDEIQFNGIAHPIYKNDLMVDLITKKVASKPVDYTYKDNAEKIANRYFRKRLHMDCLDHGIISGYVFYNQLVENYLKQLAVYQDSHPEHKIEDVFEKPFGDIKVIYRPIHLLLFKYIADAIIVHNIWHYKPREKKEYTHWGLKELSAKNKLTIKDNPLAFMLGVLDTIEPTKFFNTVKPFVVLSSIDIECSDDNQLITIILKKNSKTVDFDYWYEHKLKDMVCWLDLTVKHTKGSNRITITIPNQESKNSLQNQ